MDLLGKESRCWRSSRRDLSGDDSLDTTVPALGDTCDARPEHCRAKTKYFRNKRINTNYFVTNLIGVSSTVDKLSN
jgi:hypothetical protein